MELVLSNYRQNYGGNNICVVNTPSSTVVAMQYPWFPNPKHGHGVCTWSHSLSLWKNIFCFGIEDIPCIESQSCNITFLLICRCWLPHLHAVTFLQFFNTYLHRWLYVLLVLVALRFGMCSQRPHSPDAPIIFGPGLWYTLHLKRDEKRNKSNNLIKW